MGTISHIEWTDATWNVARGCSKVDADCKYCYMYRDSLNDTRYNPKQVTRTKTVFNFPLKYKETKSSCWDGRPLIFTSSLTDFFHEDIDSYRDEAWEIIRKCPHLIFQILTKRPERIASHLPKDWGSGYDNVWLGTSIGHNNALPRLYDLCENKAKVLFVSFEPLHENLLEITEVPAEIIKKISWCIIGGESGNENGKYRYRACSLGSIYFLSNLMKTYGCKVFVKQLGTHLSKLMKLKDRHGRDVNEFPPEIRFREFPDFAK